MNAATTSRRSFPAAVQEVTYNGTAQFATGEYIFLQRTNSFIFFNGLSVSHGPVRASISFPVVVSDPVLRLNVERP